MELVPQELLVFFRRFPLGVALNLLQLSAKPLFKASLLSLASALRRVRGSLTSKESAVACQHAGEDIYVYSIYPSAFLTSKTVLKLKLGEASC